MPISLMDLPYPADALEPAISATTLEVHHGKHHRAYVDKTNTLAAAAGLADAALEEIIRSAAQRGEQGLFNQSAQVWNHGFYWMSLRPAGGAAAQGALAERINADFGSHAAFVQAFAAAATGHFASGWAWLVENAEGRLEITDSHDAGCPLTSKANPLLTVDVWEHAYYLDRRNDRGAYVAAVLDQLLNWDFAAENLARGTPWTYPG